MAEVKTHIDKRMKIASDTTRANMKLLEANTKEQLLELDDTLATNLESLNTDSLQERKAILWW